MSLKYEPSSEPLRISVKQLCKGPSMPERDDFVSSEYGTLKTVKALAFRLKSLKP